jgi:glycosyltransferase involved in cell wall biosynthesis
MDGRNLSKIKMTDRESLHILHLTAGSEPGGLSRYILDLSRHMHNLGHTVLVAGERGAWHDRFAAPAIEWIDLPMTGGPFALRRAAKRLHQQLGDRHIDVIHTHYRRPTIVARQFQKHHSAPILYTLHLSHMPLRGLRRWFTDFGDYTHAPSQGAQKWLIETAKVAREHVTVIPHGIEIASFPHRDAASQSAARQSLGLLPTATVAAFVGRLDYPKNAHWMLDVARDNPHATILLAGEGPDGHKLRVAAAKGNLTNVLFLGECDPVPVYHAADALMLPSLREGFGLVCAEAMCAGIAVLRTRTSGTEEMIVENVTGRSVEISRDAFRKAAREFLGDRAPLEKMGNAASNRIREQFTIERQVAATIELYRRIAG